ncbi:MAG TPA: DUF4388 domain-containing protein [Thermoanaerobaculia bacterium]|nr:DUF4388 domain-containing protein [Thermoanaerobaculia bacterium]
MKLEGEIGEIELIERLVELWREQFTGAIRFESDGIIKIIYFKNGDVLSASTNDRSDSIDEILMRAGKVSREHVKQALAKRKENETLGDALLNLGFITRKELTWARRVQVIGVIRSILGWSNGSFTVVADYLPKREEGTLFPLPQILVELIVTGQDRQRFEKAMDGGSAVFAKTPEFDEVFRRLGLNEDAEAIAAQIDGFNNASEIALASGRDTFNVYKLLHALSVLGVVTHAAQIVEPQVTPQVSPSSFDDFSFESAGVADAADIWSDPGEAPVVAPETAYSAPNFELDDAPVPSMSFDAEPVADSYDADSYADPATDVAESEATTAKMPAWDTPPRAPVAVPIPAAIEPAAEAEEEQWGFDEAQIETARRAAVPVSSVSATAPAAAAGPSMFARKEPKRKGRHGLLVALMTIFVLAALGYGAFWWWQKQQDEATATAAVVTTRPRRPAPRPATTTVAEATPLTETMSTSTVAPAPATTSSAPATTTTVAPATTTTMAPARTTTAAPARPTAVATASPAPQTALPVVKAKTPAAAPSTVSMHQAPNGGMVITNSSRPTTTPAPASAAETETRRRYDEMAAQFAANKAGNFTVQFAIYCKTGSVTNALRSGGMDVWFLKHGGSCYRAYYGRYGSREEAQRALASLPAALRDPAARVVSVPR